MNMHEDKRSISISATDGFTIIEAVMTLIILSIAAVGVLSAFTIGIKGSASPLIVNQATQFAQGEMDAAIGQRNATDFNSIATGNPLACVTATPGFNCSRNIFYVNPGALNTSVGGPTNYKHITVTVGNATTGVSLDTVIANY